MEVALQKSELPVLPHPATAAQSKEQKTCPNARQTERGVCGLESRTSPAAMSALQNLPVYEYVTTLVHLALLTEG